METTQKSFEQKLAFGQEGEHEVAEFLLKRGVKIMPLYQFTPDHAPFIFSDTQKIISPDLFCFSKCVFMVEVKTKNQWIKYKGVVETGINKRHFDHYTEVEKMTGLEIFLFFNHKEKEPTGIYYCRLGDFTRQWDGKVNGKKVHDEMVFYNYKTLTKIPIS
jgi:hypothetical protein